MPNLEDAGAAKREHAVLQAVEAFAVDRGHEAAGGEAEDDAGREVVLADSMAELEVLVEHGSEGERDRLGEVVSGRTLCCSPYI